MAAGERLPEPTDERPAGQHLAFLGAGTMGGTIARGLVAAGRDPRTIGVTSHGAATREKLSRELKVLAFDDNPSAAQWADVVVLGVKPAQALAVCDEIEPAVGEGTIVVSLCAGLSCALLESRLPQGTAVIRVMPNTPASVGAAISGVSGGSSASDADVAAAIAVMSAVGKAVVIPESQQDALAAISGSGPAYVFYFVEALVEAGVTQGLARPLATELAVQTLLGSARLLDETGTHPTLLREAVTSPGGTTAAALRALDDRGLRCAIQDAVAACARRSAELGAQAAADAGSR
ncbi:pyrroline-5-carboxylate reductase [Propionibacterium cyclohexanicum]|uniref:pyrroline-5-carboxylate reductase n=1 Tax=Propionibacterium cyclohexanicum TaxID=64702 RepID=UPI000A636CF7|nr:pyrroline-5-carboxylate reductase [Propionibacterium cyclohexanicum]